MSALTSLKARTVRAKNSALTRAQIERPVLAGKVIRKLTGSSSSKKETGEDATSTAPEDATSTAPEHATHVSGVAAARAAAGVPESAETRASSLPRTDGIEAAKLAAGVPAGPTAH
ncbi:hypothetical protein [Corynebacterium variabile]|uniref:hypothetical protein n=1 Tax=Corynebacterium variabile TaxID=1727 RepID=UPI001D313B8C|nr:hypothetical protein [Corynebacterium variabile]HJG47098.1 hypothetical protein [Corynebacterium variabile]